MKGEDTGVVARYCWFLKNLLEYAASAKSITATKNNTRFPTFRPFYLLNSEVLCPALC